MAASILAAEKLPAKLPIRDFKTGAAEKVGCRDAKVVRYKLEGLSGIKGDDAAITIWIDTKTLLPLKRVSRLGRTFGEVTEIYQEFTLNPPIGAKTFPLTVGQLSEAEKRLRALDQKIKAARAIQAAVRLEFRAKGKRAKGHASLLFTKENQARLNVELNEFGKKQAAEMVADGKQVKFAETPDTIAKAEADPVPATLSRRLARTLSGPGLWLTYHDLSGRAPFRFHIVSFETRAATKVNGRDTQMVTYFVVGLPGTDWDVTVWIDAKTGLPLKRLIIPIGGQPGSVTETYEIALNPKIAAGAFRLPK
jgi:outer membrane lipoprotein-sorting protein